MPRAKAPSPAAASPPEEKTVGTSPAPASAPAPVGSSKLDRLVVLLRRPEGATIAQMTEATGWQAHSVRGALAGSLRKKGHAVTSEKVDGTRCYRIAESSGAGGANAGGLPEAIGDAGVSEETAESGTSVESRQ